MQTKEDRLEIAFSTRITNHLSVSPRDVIDFERFFRQVDKILMQSYEMQLANLYRLIN